MKYIVLLALALICYSAEARAQPDIQRSHIEANVPPTEVFDSYLRRDLLAHFKQSLEQATTLVDFVALRNAPTQSGIAYPKFYLWVKVYAGAAAREEGAVRVAAVERTHFEITDYLSKSSIQSNPDAVGKVFPAALVPAIYELAGMTPPAPASSPIP